MDISSEQRDEKFKLVSQEVKDLYASEESGAFLYSIFQKHNLNSTKYKTYAITIGNVILGFYPITELASQLQTELGIEEDVAKKITADLIDFLSPVLSNVDTSVPEESVAEATTQTSAPNNLPIETAPKEPRAAETTAPVSEPLVQPIRTMEQDMDKIHGYGAYRKMYPDAGATDTTPEPPATGDPALQASDDKKDDAVHATSQEDTLTQTPTYTDNNAK